MSRPVECQTQWPEAQVANGPVLTVRLEKNEIVIGIYLIFHKLQ